MKYTDMATGFDKGSITRNTLLNSKGSFKIRNPTIPATVDLSCLLPHYGCGAAEVDQKYMGELPSRDGGVSIHRKEYPDLS